MKKLGEMIYPDVYLTDKSHRAIQEALDAVDGFDHAFYEWSIKSAEGAFKQGILYTVALAGGLLLGGILSAKHLAKKEQDKENRRKEEA